MLDIVESVEAFARHNYIVRYASVAGTTLLLYDYLLTLIDEFNLIWRSKWNTGKGLFLATRYLCFADTALVLIYLFDPSLTIASCKSVYNTSAYLIVAGIFIAEIIMSMRTYALWGRSKRLLYPMLTIFASGVTAVIVVYVKKATNIIWIASPVPNIVPCHTQDADNIKVLVAFGLLMGYECVILLLTVWIGVKQWQEDLYESPLLMRFYRDGAVYFFVLFATSAANFSIRLRRPGNGDYYDILIVIQSVLHSLLSARMILNLRLAANNGTNSSFANGVTAELTDVEFAAPSQGVDVSSPGEIDTTTATRPAMGNSLEMTPRRPKPAPEPGP